MSLMLSAVGVSLVFGIFMLLVPIALLVVLQVWVTEGDGTYIEVPAQEGGHHQEERQVNITPGAVGALAGLFLVCNIPTVVFGGIWLHYKNRRDFQDDLRKMKIEDLE